MAEVTNIVHEAQAPGRRCLLYLKHLILLSAGLTSHFCLKWSENQTGFVVQLFHAFTGFVILTTCWSSVVVELETAVSGIF